jgi:hypothetical protein
LQFFRHLGQATGGKMAAHVDEAKRSILLVTEGIESLDGRGGVVAGNLASLLKRYNLELRRRHSDSPISRSVSSLVKLC